MKVEITSSDRIGISQEILAVFADKAWNVRAIEVQRYFTFVHIEQSQVTISQVEQSLKHIDGIRSCRQIDLMPSEVREQHLQALLSRIPDAIIDLDDNGKVLALNNTALQLLTSQKLDNASVVVGQNINDFCSLAVKKFNSSKERSLSLVIDDKAYIADITPVSNQGKVNGAVLTLRSLHKLGRQLAMFQSPNDKAIEQIIGETEVIKLLISQTLRFAELDLPVLISGETGTGKELFARVLHQASNRKDSPFLSINCATLPEHLLESELFGYEAGAFTGASKSGKPGLFELAEGGTVLLDEIAEMSVYLQAKLLRFLQDYRFRRVGGTKERVANIKIVSASHQNFARLIEQQKFREDLYYRLNVLRLELPALNKRVDDIPLLVKYFLLKAAKQVNQSVPELSKAAMTLLKRYAWPGNIRQLENMIFRLVALNNQQVIDVEQVQKNLSEQLSNNVLSPLVEVEAIKDWASAQSAFEKQLLAELYPYYPTTRKLAKRLNVSHNKIAIKLRAYKLGSEL